MPRDWLKHDREKARQMGRVGGRKASHKRVRTEDYKRGYLAGWVAGMRCERGKVFRGA